MDKKKITAFVAKKEIGSVVVPSSQSYILLSTGWRIPIVEDKPSQTYSVHIEPHHNLKHPSRW
jgi:hypothetical protein